MSNESTGTPPKPRKSPLRRALKWPVRIVLALAVVWIAVYSIANYWAARSIHDQLSRIRAAKQPVTFAQLDAMTPKADKENDGGRYYAAAIALVRPPDDPGLVFDKAYDQALEARVIAPELLAELGTRVESNSLALEMLDRGSKLSGCNFSLEIKYGMRAALEQLNASRSLANAVSARTRMLAFQLHGDQAAESVGAALSMLRIYDREPVVVIFLVRLATANLFCRDVSAVLELGRPSAAALDAMEKALSPVEAGLDLRRAMQAERVYYFGLMRNIIADVGELEPDDAINGSSALPAQNPSGLPGRVLMAMSMPVHGELIDSVGNDWPQALDAFKAVTGRSHSRLAVFAGLAPTFSRIAGNCARVIAELRCTIVAVRIERYRLTNGHLPDALEQLPGGAQLPNDPFTGQPLVYRKTADGYSVYSVGESHQDGGPEAVTSKGPNWGIHIRAIAPTTEPMER